MTLATETEPKAAIRHKIKKRKYSRKGCRECKRRKIKCDEGAPACLNCSRLNKVCLYLQGLAYYDDEARAPYELLRGQKIPAAGINSKLAGPDVGQLTVKFYEPKSVYDGVSASNNNSRRARALEMQAGSPDSLSSGGNNSLMSDMSRPGSANRDHQPLDLVRGSVDLVEDQAEAMDTPLLNFLPLDMQNFLNNVNVFLDDFYISHVSDHYDGDLHFGNAEAPEIASSPNVAFPLNGLPLLDQSMNPLQEPGQGSGAPMKTNPAPAEDAFLELDMNDFSLFYDFDERTMALEGINEHLLLSNSELTDQCIAENMLREPHVYYLRLLTTTDLSYHLFPFAPLVDQNGVVKLLLTYLVRCTHLLTALLAILATFQFIRTSEKRHDDALSFYIDVCYRALSVAFTKHNYITDSANFANSIEKLLLTVLIVSTRFTAVLTISYPQEPKPSESHEPTSWKHHLRGARNLLVRYSEMTQESLKNKDPYMSSGLALAKCWFFAIEASAAMHTSFGGALSRATGWDGVPDSETMPDLYSSAPNVDLDKAYHIFVATGCIDQKTGPAYHSALLRVDLVCDIENDAVFNLYWGFNSSLMRPILAFLSVTDSVKLRLLPRVPFRWTMHILALLDKLLQERVVPDVCLHTFQIPKTSKGHPDYKGRDKLKIQESCYVAKIDANGNRLFYSWFDASHQLHGDYLSLRVMISKNFLSLPRSHPDVQYLIRKIFDGAFFIERKDSPRYDHERHHVLTDSQNYYLSSRSFDIRCVMVQSIFRLISGIIVDDDQFEKTELFFMGLLKLGNGSSLKSLDIVARVKRNREINRQQLKGEVDENIYDFYDSMDDIPFS